MVGFNLIAASDSSYVLGYSYLIMAHLGWIAGPIIMFLLIVVSYNNCLLGSLHETGGKRQIRTCDLAHYIYGTTTSSARAASSESSTSKKWIPVCSERGRLVLESIDEHILYARVFWYRRRACLGARHLSTGPSVISDLCPRPVGRGTGRKSRKGLYSGPFPT